MSARPVYVSIDRSSYNCSCCCLSSAASCCLSSSSSSSLLSRTARKKSTRFLSSFKSPNCDFKSQYISQLPDVIWPSSSLVVLHRHNQSDGAYRLLCEKFPAKGIKPYLVLNHSRVFSIVWFFM